ncbi:MAG: hypothetical protein OXG88_07080 [Gammaproteobacteria bacterium]|nr:hypothetical protein [Gammaproteobacteria bacterium]
MCTLSTAYLAWKVFRDTKDDEILMFGDCQHPSSVSTYQSSMHVLCVKIFNKSRRKAYIECVRAFENGRSLKIYWGNSIDQLGNVLQPQGAFGIKDSDHLYVRRKDADLITWMNLSVSYRIGKKVVNERLPYQYLKYEAENDKAGEDIEQE